MLLDRYFVNLHNSTIDTFDYFLQFLCLLHIICQIVHSMQILKTGGLHSSIIFQQTFVRNIEFLDRRIFGASHCQKNKKRVY